MVNKNWFYQKGNSDGINDVIDAKTDEEELKAFMNLFQIDRIVMKFINDLAKSDESTKEIQHSKNWLDCDEVEVITQTNFDLYSHINWNPDINFNTIENFSQISKEHLIE